MKLHPVWVNNNEIPSKPMENKRCLRKTRRKPWGNRDRCVRWLPRTVSNTPPSSPVTGLVLPENFMEDNRNLGEPASRKRAATVNAVPGKCSSDHSHVPLSNLTAFSSKTVMCQSTTVGHIRESRSSVTEGIRSMIICGIFSQKV